MQFLKSLAPNISIVGSVIMTVTESFAADLKAKFAVQISRLEKPKNNWKKLNLSNQFSVERVTNVFYVIYSLH